MADSSGSGTQDKGIEALKRHILTHKLEFTLLATRFATILFTFGYFIPIIGNPYSAYYRVLLANAAISALRLHQRLPQPSASREFLIQLFSEDSCHYLFYSLIFLYVSPLSLVLLPVFLFSLIHFSSYGLNLLDILGQNSWWGCRLLISIVEFQSRNILRLIAFTEIVLMPLLVFVLFLGRAGLLTPLVYYHFLTLRFASRRNPHSRLMFHELRLKVESIINQPNIPAILRSVVQSSIDFISKLAPQVVTAAPDSR